MINAETLRAGAQSSEWGNEASGILEFSFELYQHWHAVVHVEFHSFSPKLVSLLMNGLQIDGRTPDQETDRRRSFMILPDNTGPDPVPCSVRTQWAGSVGPLMLVMLVDIEDSTPAGCASEKEPILYRIIRHRAFRCIEPNDSVFITIVLQTGLGAISEIPFSTTA